MSDRRRCFSIAVSLLIAVLLSGCASQRTGADKTVPVDERSEAAGSQTVKK